VQQHSAVRLRKPFHNFNFSLRAHLMARVMRHGRDSRDGVGWRQADDKAVGVVEDDGVVDRQVKR
jgi:hypothetical protein